MTEAEIRQIVQDEYQNLGSRFGVNQTPIHSHNNIDSPQLDPSSVKAFIALPATPSTSVIGQANLYAQPVGQAYPQLNASRSNVYSPSIPYITGYGVGDASAFNGGTAPDGSILLFSNGSNISQIWWHVGGSWRGINVDFFGTVTGLLA